MNVTLTRHPDHRLYFYGAMAAFTVVFAGFARSYFLKTLFGAPALPWLVHLHGAMMTSWFLLFFVQTRLISAHRVDWHRRLGVFGAVLAGLMVIVGATVAIRAAARDIHVPSISGAPPLMFMGFALLVLLVFAILVTAALLLRRRTDWHRRLMLLSCLTLVEPGLSRIPFQRISTLAFLSTGGPGGLFGLDLLLVYACIAWDTWRHRKLQAALVCAVLPIALEDLPLIWVTDVDALR